MSGQLAPVGYASATSSAAIKSSPGAVVAVNICGGADAATVAIYDNTSGSGTIICKLGVAAGASASFCPCAPIKAAAGIYATITGTTPQVNVAFL
jgi:hypothetical protein